MNVIYSWLICCANDVCNKTTEVPSQIGNGSLPTSLISLLVCAERDGLFFGQTYLLQEVGNGKYCNVEADNTISTHTRIGFDPF